MPYPPATTPPSERYCGRCAACCTHLPIPAGVVGPAEKPAGRPCPSVGSAGCRIYEKRPPMCAEFACVWLRDSLWPPGWRPDRCGLMCLRELLDSSVPAAAVYEIRPGSLDRPGAAQILAALQQTTAVIAIVDFQGGRRRTPGYWSGEAAHEPVPQPHFAALGAMATPASEPERVPDS